MTRGVSHLWDRQGLRGGYFKWVNPIIRIGPPERSAGYRHPSPPFPLMKPWNLRRQAVSAIALLMTVSLPHARANEAPEAPTAETGQTAGEAAMHASVESLALAAERFVEAFNNRNAAGIATLFLPFGEIIRMDGGTVSGRGEIEAYYAGVFEAEVVPQIALEAKAVHFVTGEVAVEDGLVHLTVGEDEPVQSVSYSVTHIKQADGSWLIATSREKLEVTPPSERIKPLHWLIGEWTLEGGEGLRIDMVIDLDDRGNYLLGEALITDASEGAQSTTLRIGWNPATSSVYWWTFDSEGGNSSGRWARSGDGWFLQVTGVTSEAEASSSVQSLVREGDAMVWRATHRQLAGEALPDMNYRFVRRAPDPVSLLDPGPPEEGESPESDDQPE